MININKLVKYLLLITLFVFLTGCVEQDTVRRGLARVPPPSQTAASGQRVALVIGNGTYKKAPLPNPLNDADDMTQVLEQTGFKVTKLKNASLPEMKTAIQAFGRKLNDGGVGLFYFAGHGVQYQGENYLFPIGATINVSTVGHLPYETLQANYVLAVMEDAKNSLNLVFLDACRNNQVARSLFRSRGMEEKEGLAPMQAPSGSLIAYATRPNRRALDGEGRNSPYVKFLKKELLKPGLEIEKMLKNVRVLVRQETNEYQAPGYYFSFPNSVWECLPRCYFSFPNSVWECLPRCSASYNHIGEPKNGTFPLSHNQQRSITTLPYLHYSRLATNFHPSNYRPNYLRFMDLPTKK